MRSLPSLSLMKLINKQNLWLKHNCRSNSKGRVGGRATLATATVGAKNAITKKPKPKPIKDTQQSGLCSCSCSHSWTCTLALIPFPSSSNSNSISNWLPALLSSARVDEQPNFRTQSAYLNCIVWHKKTSCSCSMKDEG